MKKPLGELVDGLSISNLKIWHMEEGLRRAEVGGEDADVPDDVAGRLAKAIRDENRRRTAFVNALNEYDVDNLGPVRKVNHRSG